MITPCPDLRFFWWENTDWMDAHTVPEAASFCLYHPRKHCITEHQLSGHNCITVPAFHLQESCSVLQERWLQADGVWGQEFPVACKIYLSLWKTFLFRGLCWLEHWVVSALLIILLLAGTSCRRALAQSLSSQSAGEYNECLFNLLIPWCCSQVIWLSIQIQCECTVTKFCWALEQGAQGFLPGIRHIYTATLHRRELSPSTIRQQK